MVSFSLAAKQGRGIVGQEGSRLARSSTPGRWCGAPMPFPASEVYQQLSKSEPFFEKCWHKTREQKGKAAFRDLPKIAALQNATAHLAQLPRTYLHMFRPTGPLNTLPSFQASQGNESSLPAHQGNAEHCRHPFSTGG